MKSKTFVIPSGVTVVLIILSILGIIGWYFLSDQNKSISSTDFSNTRIIIPTTSPVPKQPSDRALKIAAFVVTNSPSDTVLKAKKDRGNPDMTNTELIKIIALEKDSDPAALAEGEAIIEKYNKEKSRPIVNVEPPSVNVEQPDYPTHCTSTGIGSSVYTNCY